MKSIFFINNSLVNLTKLSSFADELLEIFFFTLIIVGSIWFVIFSTRKVIKKIVIGALVGASGALGDRGANKVLDLIDSATSGGESKGESSKTGDNSTKIGEGNKVGGDNTSGKSSDSGGNADSGNKGVENNTGGSENTVKK